MDHFISRFDNGIQIFPDGRIAFWDLGSRLIINGKQYALFRSIADLRKGSKATPTGRFALADDYDAASDGVYGTSPIYRFYGTLEGLGNTISNLSVTSNRTFVGLVGENQGQLRDKWGQLRDVRLANANVVGTREDANVGTLVASNNYGVIYNCSSTGGASNASNGYAGGLVGYTIDSQIIRSRASVSVEGVNAGGLVGVAGDYSGISQSFATGSVSGSTYAGGLVGVKGNSEHVIDSYAAGSVNSNSNAGGLAGEEGSSTDRSYAIGVVQSPQNAGGVFGYIIGTAAGDIYWDVDTSGMNQGCGELYFADCSHVVGLSDAQMKSGLPANFDPNIWKQDPSINNGYPYLLANPPPQ